MLRELFSNRLFIGALAFFILCVVGGTLYIAYIERQGIEDVVSETEEPIAPLAEKPKPPPPGETSESGHWHGDEWHSEPHDPPAVFAGESYIPEGADVTPNFPLVDPNNDPVEAAYKRLEYIKNNPYAWGGVHSERATELIAQLMPPPPLRDEGHGEVVIEQILELIAQNDPRAGEVLIVHMCEGDTVGVAMFDGLDAIGPPAVPYILPYLEKGVAEGGRIRLAVFESLGRIGKLYRGDLGGIVDHIIIPKLEIIAADEDTERYDWASVLDARGALLMLK